MTAKELGDWTVKYWAIIVAIVAVISAAAVYAATLPRIEKRVECLELRVQNVEQTLPAILSDVSWIRTYIENGGHL